MALDGQPQLFSPENAFLGATHFSALIGLIFALCSVLVLVLYIEGGWGGGDFFIFILSIPFRFLMTQYPPHTSCCCCCRCCWWCWSCVVCHHEGKAVQLVASIDGIADICKCLPACLSAYSTVCSRKEQYWIAMET